MIALLLITEIVQSNIINYYTLYYYNNGVIKLLTRGVLFWASWLENIVLSPATIIYTHSSFVCCLSLVLWPWTRLRHCCTQLSHGHSGTDWWYFAPHTLLSLDFHSSFPSLPPPTVNIVGLTVNTLSYLEFGFIHSVEGICFSQMWETKIFLDW